MATFILAIDGPAGAGKSTVARRCAQALGYCLVDTGAIYRAVALRADRAGVAFEDEAGVASGLSDLALRFELQGETNHVFLEGEDVSRDIRTPRISMGASTVSAHPAVRAGLLELQRRLARETDLPGSVLEGRDIGTVVFPDADLKIFLTASPEARAERRYLELKARGEATTFEDVLEEQRRRDAQDSGREVAPLREAEDAVRVDTTGLGIDEVVGRIVELARSA
ncbi:MAG: (d)CMP kinase [Deltaproteobacteria bacterium]|nr:(d)CMP kinase [Deltaproteobacteria bacterium]